MRGIVVFPAPLEHLLHELVEFLGLVSLTTWVYLAFFHARFWRMAESEFPANLSPHTAPAIRVLIPARDEAELIGKAVGSLLTQDYPGPIEVLVIDDGSSDGTREAALEAAHRLRAGDRLQVLSASTPPPGWTGKLWALAEGLRQLSGLATDYFLLTDADIIHSPDEISQLVARAESGNFDLVSLMAKLRCDSLAERALIPAFLFFFFMLYPPARVSNRKRKSAAAAGGCILIRPGALERIGGPSSIHDQLIDDCALAKRVKKTGGRIYLGTTARTRSLRAYGSWRDVEQMISRTAFTQLGHSAARLVGTCIALAVVFLVPPLLLMAGLLPALLGLSAWLLMSICFSPSLRLYQVSALWAPTLPLVAAFYIAASIHSAVLHWQGRGGLWKGRLQNPTSASHSPTTTGLPPPRQSRLQ